MIGFVNSMETPFEWKVQGVDKTDTLVLEYGEDDWLRENFAIFEGIGVKMCSNRSESFIVCALRYKRNYKSIPRIYRFIQNRYT